MFSEVKELKKSEKLVRIFCPKLLFIFRTRWVFPIKYRVFFVTRHFSHKTHGVFSETHRVIFKTHGVFGNTHGVFRQKVPLLCRFSFVSLTDFRARWATERLQIWIFSYCLLSFPRKFVSLHSNVGKPSNKSGIYNAKMQNETVKQIAVDNYDSHV